MAKRDSEDSAQIKAIEQKLPAIPEVAKLTDKLGSTSATTVLIRGLETERDAHLG